MEWRVADGEKEEEEEEEEVVVLLIMCCVVLVTFGMPRSNDYSFSSPLAMIFVVMTIYNIVSPSSSSWLSFPPLSLSLSSAGLERKVRRSFFRRGVGQIHGGHFALW
jgi:hypothetical protein